MPSANIFTLGFKHGDFAVAGCRMPRVRNGHYGRFDSPRVEVSVLAIPPTHLRPFAVNWLHRPKSESSSYATASLLLAVLGLILFGVSSLPAIVSGCLARRRIARFGFNSRAARTARSGIIIGFAGLLGWSAIAFLII
jgi:hypothetical protein